MNYLIPLALGLFASSTALAAADLTTTVTVNTSPTLTYSSATYTVAVRNIGNKGASNSTVRIALPATHTSPQVYVLGVLGATSASCARAGTTLTCTLGTIAKSTTKTVFFNIALPVSSVPYVIPATASTTSAENTLANNTGSLTAAESYYSTPINTAPGVPVTMVNDHCTGTGLTSWYECTLFPGAVSSHDTVFHDDGTITIPGDPSYTGQWTLTPTAIGSHLYFYYDDGTGIVAEFDGWGADNFCFEGLTTFGLSPYVAPYSVCPF